jgi:hypothetical protein
LVGADSDPEFLPSGAAPGGGIRYAFMMLANVAGTGGGVDVDEFEFD